VQHALKIQVTVGKDHIIRLPSEVPEGPAEVIVIPAASVPTTTALPQRGMGMDAGRFVVPDDFNSPLPADIQRGFEGDDSDDR
jgi:hypothetical protein